MMTTLIALFTLFASTFGVFIGLYEDSRDKVLAYVAVRAAVGGILRRSHRRILVCAARLVAAVAHGGDVGNVLRARQSELSFCLPIPA